MRVGAVANPFEAMAAAGYTDSALKLAIAFSVANSWEEFCACLKYNWALHCASGDLFDPKSYDLFGFIHGRFFVAFCDRSSVLLPGAFETLHSMGTDYREAVSAVSYGVAP